MQRKMFSIEADGFYGAWYPNPRGKTSRAMIITLDGSSDNRMIVSGAKWLHRQNIHALAISPCKKDHGWHNFPLERIGKAIEFLRAQGCDKIGIFGASATGTVALAAASFYPDIRLTIALTPPDFIMEGFYRDGKDGVRERPGDHESAVSWQGIPLPYLPYAYRHPEYWQKMQEESKASGNLIAAREMFAESERRHLLIEEEKIKVERIRGKVICIGAEDDALWDTCKYIRRMRQRLETLPHDCDFEAWIYEHGTHFIFPESMLKLMLPIGSGLLVSLMFKAGKEHPRECKETRLDIDRRLAALMRDW